jgi:hypothetical protein
VSCYGRFLYGQQRGDQAPERWMMVKKRLTIMASDFGD